MDQIKKEILKLQSLVKPISLDDLRRGDHIYVRRALGQYSHHGIYVGDGNVIHLRRTQSQNEAHKIACPTCGYNPNKHQGIVKTCLNCFINPEKWFGSKRIHRYEYGISKITYALLQHPEVHLPGTMYFHDERSPDVVVKTAEDLLKNPKEFGEYSLVSNNCEDFAVFCKTGQRFCTQREVFIRLDKIKEVLAETFG